MEENTGARKTRSVKKASRDRRAVNIGVSCQLDPGLKDLILQPKSDKIARPPNAFMLFAREHRKALAVKYPDHSNKVISSMLGKCWQSMDSVSKDQYYEKARLMQELHKQKYPGYIYSPRIARMRKLEKREKRKNKNGTQEVKIESNAQSNNSIVVAVKNPKEDNTAELYEPSSPGYVPNNPLFFADVKPEEETASEHSQEHDCILPEWISPPRFPPSTSGRSSVEFGRKFGPCSDTFYHTQARHGACRYDDCEEQRASFCYAPPTMYPRWSPPQVEYAGPNIHRSRYSLAGPPAYKSSLFPRYQDSHSMPPSDTMPPYQCSCGPFQNCKPGFCSLPPCRYMNWKISHEDQARTYYRNMDNCCDRQPELSPEDRRSFVPHLPPMGGCQKTYEGRPAMRQSAPYITYVDGPHYLESDSRELQQFPNTHCITGSNENFSYRNLGDNNSRITNMPKLVANTEKQYSFSVQNRKIQKGDSESNNLIEASYDNDDESNSTESNLQKNDSSCLQESEINSTHISNLSESYRYEFELNHPHASDGNTTNVIYLPKMSSEGVEYQTTDDEIINVVDVVDETHEDRNVVVEEESQ